MLYDILAVIVTIAILVLIIYFIPMINQLKKTARSAERFFDVTEGELRPFLKELKETASQANRISSGAREGVDKIVSFLEAVEDIGKTIKSVNLTIRGASNSFLITLAAFGVGVRRGLEVFFKGLLRGGDNNGKK